MGKSIRVFLTFVILSCTSVAVQAGAQYIYDETNRLVGAIDSTGNTTQYQYDNAGNIFAITNTAVNIPAIIEFTPDQGPVGTQVTLYGTAFNTTASSNVVKFNGVQATVISSTANKLVVTVPNGATSGKLGITIGTQTATSAGSFTVTTAPVNAQPVITDFTPKLGPAGTTVTITGNYFETLPINNSIKFNLSNTLVSSATTTQLLTSVPNAGSSGKITVKTPYGKTISSADFFTLPSGLTAAQVSVTGRLIVDGSALNVNTATAGKVGIVLFDGIQNQSLGLGISPATISPTGTASLERVSKVGRSVIS